MSVTTLIHISTCASLLKPKTLCLYYYEILTISNSNTHIRHTFLAFLVKNNKPNQIRQVTLKVTFNTLVLLNIGLSS